jgi:sigma-B regulation protein RsbU (phosphoserine phosphatase)
MERTALKVPSSNHHVRDLSLQKQLLSRRDKLKVASRTAPSERLQELLHEVDAALERMNAGTFGICETCHDTIENDRLLLDPLCRNCLDHLSTSERRALERDLDLAFQVQRGLLPEPQMQLNGWSVAYAYEPAGPVSGDYCDLIPIENGGFFMLGDVSGKGVAASMLMAQLHAIFRSLVPTSQSVSELVMKANHVFCQANPFSYFATLVCGRIGGGGVADICNAGHCLPLHLSGNHVVRLESGGLPVGVFADGEYQSQQVKLAVGESLILYSDGLSEAFNPNAVQYGIERLEALVHRQQVMGPRNLLTSVLQDVNSFRAGAPRTDDLTVMILRRDS